MKMELLLLSVLSTLLILFQASRGAGSNVYIVYIAQGLYRDEAHYEILASALGSEEAVAESLLYSYRNGFSGFAAKLTHEQATFIAGLPGVAYVMPNKVLNLHTTHSWDFLRIDSSFSDFVRSGAEEDIIIGFIDTGIWPESESFSDADAGPVPSRWKGICQDGDSFNSSNCNRKIIGARWYIKGYEAQFGPLNTSEVKEFLSPRDPLGHGSHTSSTAAGVFVHNVSYMGLASGSARGGAPQARIAAYKACWADGDCSSADILAAFDDAVGDGVDVISVSLGEPPPLNEYFDDPVAIGSFHAIKRGIVVVTSAGNTGPFSESVINTAPWLITVAASTIDRSFPTTITLGNNLTLKGQSFNTKNDGDFHSIVYAEDIANSGSTASRARSCASGSLNATLAKNKFVLCFQIRARKPSSIAASTVYKAKGIGVIYAQISTKTVVSSPLIPCVQVDYEVGTKILSYLRSSRLPVLKVSAAQTVLGKTLAPEVAYFSSRGPSSLTPSVLKPDIAAPGVDILAAWSPASSPSDVSEDRLVLKYKMASGTSMACPHVSGIVALLKGSNPTWSPAAVKSALVTTASITSNHSLRIVAEASPHKLADPFDYGGGQVNPRRAANPGLVYDMEAAEYLPFLCSLGYNESAIHVITGEFPFCKVNESSVNDLNQPSFAIPNLTGRLEVSRTVTNVGPEWSLYRVKIESPLGVTVKVKPSVISFNPRQKKQSFKVIFSPEFSADGSYSFGAIIWSDGFHTVRSPIAVRTMLT